MKKLALIVAMLFAGTGVAFAADTPAAGATEAAKAEARAPAKKKAAKKAGKKTKAKAARAAADKK